MRVARAALLSLSVAMLPHALARAAADDPVGSEAVESAPAGAREAASVPASVDPSLAQIASRAPELLARYIRIDTTNPPGHEIEGARFLAELLEAESISATILESEPGRASVYARLAGNGTRKALLLLNHIDVVPVD